jgi:hypothetical protein
MKSSTTKLLKKILKKINVHIFQSTNRTIIIGKDASLDFENLKLGEKIRLLEPLTTNSNINKWLLSNITRTHSQYFQDLLILFLTGFKKNGFFVEFGACDGVELSNTLLLENSYEWSGILSEPLYDFQERLAKNRKCKLDYRAVWSESDKNIYLENFGPLGLSKFNERRNIFKFKNKRNKAVRSISLNDLLLFHSAPKEIDFISVDTEGTEFEILDTFPFHDWKIRVFCIEHNFSKNRFIIQALMEKNNYMLLNFICDPIDDWYILKN